MDILSLRERRSDLVMTVSELNGYVKNLLESDRLLGAVTVKGMCANLSGLENLAIKLYEESGDASQTSAFVLDYIGRALELTCDALVEEQGKMPFVFAGGVMCNSIIKERLHKRFNGVFAEPAMSADNAVGIAALTLRAWTKK